MEDEERRRKLETGRAKLAEYRQKKAQSDGQKKQKKKRSKGSEQQEGVVLPEESGQRKDSSHYCLSRTIRSGETVTHDHTYTIEPESEVSTTAEDYSSEEEESRPLLDTTESQSHLQAMEDELREKNAALEELSRELDEIRAAFGTEGVQQLQDFEAALKQRDAIITQLTANLQQARTEKDDVMKEFLQLTEQSHKLQLQFQQLQAGETLRSSSISSTAADLLQTRQQVLYHQQQLEEKDTQVRGLQERLEEKDTQVKDLQEKLVQVAQLQQSLSHIQAVKREAEESFAQRLQEKDLQISQQEKLRSEQQQLLFQLQDNLQASKNNLNEISEQLAAKTRELEVCESELQTSRQKERLSSGEIQQLMGTVEDLQKRYHYKGAEQGDAALKMAHLRAELDEMYGQQIVQMKQELSARHAEELAHIQEQHSTELEKISENLKAKWTQSAGEANVLNARVVELQQKLQENQVLREKAEQDLAQMSEDKVLLHNRVQELVEDLCLAKQSKETEKSQMDLQVEIADLQAKLAAAQEASTELEAKHESEITNYQIKLEMLEREKDAVLDRMAESQEAELERLRTQLLFCHEEELSRLREDLQHENQMNMENLRDELRQVRNGCEAEKALLDAERTSLLQEILVLKEDLSRALENSRVDELVSQLNELQTEIQELRTREGHREGTVLECTSDSTWKDHLESENKLLKGKEGIMVEELKSLRENREVLMNKIESFTADTEQANKLVEELKAEIQRQKTTFSLAEKNFEVNYQKLRDELEERIKEQMLQYEMTLQSLQTKLGTLEETDGGALVEKDTIELMEKLQKMEMVKAELEEKVEQKEMELQRIKAEKVELLKQKDMELQRVEGELQKVELEKAGLLKQKEVGLRRVKVEKAELLQKQQILALEEEVQELRRRLRSMGRDEDEDDEEGAEPVDDLLARPLAQREGEGESGERRTHTLYSASEQVGDEATEPTVPRPLRMEGSDHEECRLQMEALRISLSQIHAAQLELLKENLHKQGTVSRDEAVEQRYDQELHAQMVCDDQTEKSVNVHILSAAGTALKGEEPELDRRLILEFREQRELQEQQHQQELQRLRSYYRQQVEETEERFQNEIVLLQSRLEELSGTSAVYSVQRVSPPVHQGAELLQDESEERARDTEDLQRQRDEDIAKVIVQMCVEFAQQTELTRISRESENQERERLQEEIAFLQEKLDTLESLTQTQQDTSPEDQEGPHWAEHEEEEEVSEGEHTHQEDEDQERKVRVDGPEGECGDLQVRRDSDQSKDEDRTLSSFASGEDEEDHDETGENGEKVYDRKGSGPPREGSREVHGGDKRKNKGRKGDHTQCSGDQRRGSQDHKDDSGNYYKETSRGNQKECCREDQRDDSGRHQREDSIGDPKEEFVDHVKDFGGDSRVNTRIQVSGDDQRKQSGEVLKEGSRDSPRGGSVAMSKSHEDDDDEDDEDEEDVGGVDEARALLAQLKYKLALQAEEHALVLEELRSSHILQVERNQDQLTQLTAHLHFLSTHLEQGAEQKQRMDGAEEESSGREMQHPSMQSSGTQTLDSTHMTSGEGDEEEEKMEKEKEGVMSQLSSQDTERDLLRKANVKLCKVLMDVLKTTAATEETIGRHIEPQRDVSSESLPSSEVTQEDTSVFSVETETDEGLEMSQMMLEAGLQHEGCGLQLEEASLQLEREEYLSTISSRLQSAVEKLLFTITETTSQLEHARLTQTELIKEKFRHAEEISELLRRQEELQEKLQEEASARQHLALQLHDAEGLIDGYSGERRALEEQLRERAELQLQLEQELQVTTNRLQELEQERNNVHHQRELLQRQQEAMRDGVSGRELHLLEETEKLMQEKVEVQLQAEKDHGELLQQVKHLEAELEEQEGRFNELEEAHRAETADFTQQISALEKQLENNRRFLDEQAVDREHERDVFQQEIQKLEQQLKNVPKPQPSSDQHHREVEELSGALKEKTDWCSELLLKVEQLQREVEEREEEIQKLESHNRELIANSLTLKSEEESKQYACMATGDDVTLESLLQTEREALDRKEKEIVNLEEQLEQFREELQNKSEEVQQLHMQLEIQRKEIHTQQQELHTQSHLHTEVEEKSEELEAQVEYLRGEQERLKRDNEEEVERLNSVIEKLQQDLANIQHKQSLEEEEELKQKLEEELKEKMEEGLKQKMEEELKQDLKQRLEMELEQRMEEDLKQRMEEEQRPRMEEKLKQKMEEELKLDLKQKMEELKQRMEEEQKPRMEEELKQDLKNKMEVLKQRMEEELKQKMEDELKQDLKQKMEELRPSMEEDLKLKMEEELKQDLNQKMEDLRPRMEEDLKLKMEDELKQDLKQKMEDLRPRMEEELKQKMEDELKQDLKQKMDELRPRMEEELKLKMEEELKQDLKQKMEELRPRMEEELKQKMEKDLKQKMEELRPRMEEELKLKMEEELKQDLKQKMEELKQRMEEEQRPSLEEELKQKMEEELKQDLNQKIEELRPRMEEELKQKMEKDLKQKMEELKQRMEEEQRPSLEEELKQKMEDKLTQELKHKTEEVKQKMEEELKQDLQQNIEKELMQKMDEELKQKMDEVMKELDSLKVEHSSLLVSYESLQLEAMERDRQGDRSLVSLQESLQDALRERSAALLVAQAQVQALEESANSRMMDLTQRIEELQECVEEKEMELHACRLQVQRAKDDAQTLNLKISQLEDKLREKVAAVLVTQAQLEAVQVQAQTKEHHMDEEELELEEAAEDLTSEEIRKRNLCNPENFEHLGKEGRVGYLSEKLLGLEQGLSSMLRDQELQKELLNSSEEEVQEYHQRLNSLLELLQQLRTTSAPTSAQAVSDGVSEMETVLQELQHVKDEAAETKGELNTCRELNLKLQEQIQMKEAVIEKLEEELQKASECEEDSRSASNLLQELQQVKDEAAETKEELTTCRELSLKLQEQIQEREMTIALLKDQLHRASGEVETSELLQELQEVREQAAEAKEELNSYIERSQKLQEQIQARDLSIAQMMEELQQLRSALSKPSEDTPASSQSRKKSAKHGEGKGKSSSAVAKDKLSVSRKSSDRSSNGSQTRSDAETQVQRNEQVSQELQEVISQYTERIGQMRELHAAEIMDMENRHISESESLKRENQRLEEECNALRATLNNIRTNEAVRLDLPASSQFRDGYASDSSSEWSQRTGFDPPHLQGEFRSTPEGARRDDSDIMSHRIKTLLREVHQEGMQVLSLSEISVPEAEHSSEQLPLEVWRREKEALLDNVESLKTLITQLQMHSQSQSETQTAGDWRADLLRAVQQVFLRERQVLKITLLTQLDLLDTRDSIIHLNQLERVLTEQDAVHQEALCSLQSADRHSLLSEISHLRAQLQHLQQAMPIPQQATPLSQQDTQPHLVDVTGMSEAQQKMGREKDGERDQQREEKVPPAVEDLKGELAQTKLELELSLKTQSKHLKELETLRAELCVKSSELDAQTDRLSEEQKRARELQWALEREKNRAERREEGEREELEDLRLALEDQKTHVSDLSLSLEEEKKVSSRLREERDGEISKQININSELQVQLDAQKLQVVELSSSLQKEKEMNVQLLKQLQFSSSESQRPLQAMSEEGVDQAEASCSQVEEGVACVELLLQSLQDQLSEKQKTLAETMEKLEVQKLQEVQVKGAFAQERTEMSRRLQEATESLNALHTRAQELQTLLDGERERGTRLERERDSLQRRVSEVMERSQRDNQTALRGAEGHSADRTRDWVLQQKAEESGTLTSSSTFGVDAAGQTTGQNKNLDNVVNRLQLIASRINTMTSSASSLPQEGPDREALSWLHSNVQDVLTLLQPTQTAPPAVPESATLLTGGSSSALTERLLRQNAELTGFVSRLTEEKNELRNQLLRLEEELRRQRHLSTHSSVKSGSEGQELVLFSGERESWMREKKRLEKSLRETEAELSRLRGEMRSDTIRDITTSDTDNTALKRMYGKYLRAESFRKALIYQKKYLLLLLGGFQECEEATLSLIARMGGRPSYPQLDTITQRRRGFTRFRSAVRVSIALSRMRFLVRRWKKASGGSLMSPTIISRNGLGQSPGTEGRNDSPYLQPSVEQYGERRGTNRTGRESPRAGHYTHHRCGVAVGDGGSVLCSHLQNYDPDRALSDYISRLEALQRRLGSVQSGSSSYAQLHFGIRR